MALYSWGANSHGQLGLSFANELCITPQRLARLPFNVTAVQSIIGGGGHVLILDNSGQLYSCGWNNRGQLGLNCKQDQNELRPIPMGFFDDSPVEKIACGWDSSGAITADRKLYVWGSNCFQQLGLCQRGFNSVSRPLHMSLPRNEEPVQISFGLRHCCILTSNNTVYIFGKLKLNEFNTGITHCTISHNQIDIVRLQTNISIKMISSGQNHLLLSDGHQILGLGDNKYGQTNSFRFDQKLISMVSGWTHNGILTKNNEIFLWGRNTYGQIGRSSQQMFKQPNKLEFDGSHIPRHLCLGSEHGLAITKDNKILTWGWNEHGNCGNGTTENLYTPSIIDLPSNCVLAGTGAGFCYALCE